MYSRKIFLFTCLILSTICLTIGYGLSKQWIGSLAGILMLPVWLLAHKYSNSGLPLICLLVSLGLAVIGQLTDSSPLLMLCSSAFSLAVWDLLLLDATLGSATLEEHTWQYERKHLQSLTFALCTGFFVVFLGRLSTFKIPFVLLVLCVVLAIAALDRAFSQIKKSRVDR
jgi:hypothetical protein